MHFSSGNFYSYFFKCFFGIQFIFGASTCNVWQKVRANISIAVYGATTTAIIAALHSSHTCVKQVTHYTYSTSIVSVAVTTIINWQSGVWSAYYQLFVIV